MADFIPKKDIFISYRRSTGSADAVYLEERLTSLGYSVFLDVKAHEDGKFSAKLIRAISECTDFILLCTENALDRCEDEDDVVRQEIALALSLKKSGLPKHIIPVLKPPFEFPEKLPDDIDDIRVMDGVPFPPYTLIDALIGWFENNLHAQKTIKQEDIFNHYYQYANAIFEATHENSVLGNVSRSMYYIPAYYRGSTEDHPLTEYLSEWLRKKRSGVMLLHGEPGHGKTTFCLKTVYDFSHGEKTYLPDIQNVFWFSLNPSNSDIINREKHILEIENVFSWAGGSMRVPPDQLMNSLVFLDGFDELLPMARMYIAPDYSLLQFIRKMLDFSIGHQIHLVITTRSFLVYPDIAEFRDLLAGGVLRMAPLSSQQQYDWIKAQMPDYLPTFIEMLEKPGSDLSSIIGIPLIFRMVVALRFKGSAENIVDFYGTLLDEMLKRKQFYERKDSVVRFYENLAYMIFRYDEDSVEVDYRPEKDPWIYSFFMSNDQSVSRIGFLHKSFYQYFLAHYFFRLINEAIDQTAAEDFLCRLADRKLDATVIQYMQIIAGKSEGFLRAPCKCILTALEKTEGILPASFDLPDGSTASARKTDRINNTINNTFSLLSALNQPVTFRGSSILARLLRAYDGTETDMEQVRMEKADLRQAQLSRVNLFGAELAGSNFSQADLNGADMTRVILDNADLTRANLSHSKLISASCKNTVFRYADLTHADLRLTDLTGADFTGADVEGMIVDDAILTDVKGMAKSVIEQNTESKKIDTIKQKADSQLQYFYAIYSRKDIAVVLPIIERLRKDGYPIWYDDDLVFRLDWQERIAETILKSQGILCFLSEASQASRFARDEFMFAMSNNKICIPVQISDTELSAAYRFFLARHQRIRYYSESDFNVFIQRLESAMEYTLYKK